MKIHYLLLGLYLVQTPLASAFTPGSLDPTFRTRRGGEDEVNTVLAMPGGKVLIGGEFETYENQQIGGIAQLNAKGAVDPNFNPGFGFDTSVRSMVRQADGKVLVIGNFARFNVAQQDLMARILPNGRIDPGFDYSLGPNDILDCVALQKDQKILVGGNFTTWDGEVRNYIARLLPDACCLKSYDTCAEE